MKSTNFGSQKNHEAQVAQALGPDLVEAEAEIGVCFWG